MHILPEPFRPLIEAMRDHRFWRNIWTFVAIGAALAQTFVTGFWKESHPPILRGRRATTMLRSRADRTRKPVVVLIGLVLVAAIGLEWYEGNRADDAADRIQTVLEWRVVEMSPNIFVLGSLLSTRKAPSDLAKFAGQRAAICASWRNSDTSFSATAIARTLDKAGWRDPDGKPFETPNPEGTGVRETGINWKCPAGSGGIVIETNRAAPKRTKEAAAALFGFLSKMGVSSLAGEHPGETASPVCKSVLRLSRHPDLIAICIHKK